MRQVKRAKSLAALPGGGVALTVSQGQPAVTDVQRASRQPAVY